MTTAIQIGSGSRGQRLRLVGPVVAGKLTILLLIYWSRLLIPMNYYGDSIGRMPLRFVPLSASYRAWDANFYLEISQHGYRPGTAECNFFPLWPLVIRVITLPGCDPLVPSLIAANLLSLAAILLLHRLAALRWDIDTADTAVLLLLAFPSAFLLCVPYSEPLFLLLATGLFLAMHNQRHRWIWALGLLLPLSRPVGFLCIIPVIVDQFLRGRRIGAAAMASGPLIGLGIYFAVMQLMTGDWLANVHAQQNFGTYTSLANLWHPREFFDAFFTPDITLHGFLNSGIDRTVLILWLAAFVWMAIKRQWLDLAYSLPLTIVPAVSVSLMSFTRHSMLAFPVFFVAARLLSASSRRLWLVWVLSFLFALQVLLLTRFAHYSWAN